MKNYKIIFAFLLIITLLFLASCSTAHNNENPKISVVCTAFSQYDWAREIVGDKSDRFDIVCLSDNGVDMHSYQPTVDDIVKISDCDILISVGGASEKWVRDALDASDNKNVYRLELIELLGDDIIHQNCGDECDSEHAHDHFSEVDEHVWLSLKNAIVFCEEIARAIGEYDPENAPYYAEKSQDYIQKLRELDNNMVEFMSCVPCDTIIVADRFPFRYTARDYGINYHAAFEGCTADSEVSFETLAFLSQKADELNVKAIFVTDSSDTKLAQAVSRNTVSGGQTVFGLNSMQSVTRNDIKDGMTYLSVMQSNLALIQSALSV